MSNGADDYGPVLAAVREELNTRFENLDQNEIDACASQIVHIVRTKLPQANDAVPLSSRSFGPSRSIAEVTSVRGWKRFIPTAFFLVAWFTAWLLLFGLDRRSWATASEIALAATVSLAAVVWVWSWLERSFGG